MRENNLKISVWFKDRYKYVLYIGTLGKYLK